MNMLYLLLIFAVLELVKTAPLVGEGAEDGFWFGTQSMDCLKGKTFSKRSAPEISTIRYVHSVVYYRNQVYEWGNGFKGYHFGPNAAIEECDIEWNLEPAGSSACSPEILQSFAKEYRAEYGGYNLVTNNCHHFVNRLSAILSSPDCQPTDDRWADFSERMWSIIRPFVAVFEAGTLDHPQDIRRAESRDPNVHNDWPIIEWY